MLINVQPTHAASMGFVTRSGAQLFLNGSPFRFAGANIYWLGLDEGAQTYPTPFRIDDALTVANEMGATVVRSHSLGVSTGCPLCVEPTLGNFNTTALTHTDYAIQQAKLHGLHLIIPLTDNYHYYHGGKHNFTDWRGIADENQFYTNPTVIHDFEQYISVLLNRVNSYTGVAYKNDPTIMAWETGNELLPPASWTRQIADYIKSIDGNHLVMDGNYGIDPASLPSTSVDIYSDHFYPPNIQKMNSDATTVRNANKVFIIGEYDWEAMNGDPLNQFLNAIQQQPGVSGDLFWDIWPHSDTSGYLGLKDAINLHYPGDTYDRRNAIQTMRAHGFAMSGLAVPPDSVPGIPFITSIQGNQVAWRGTPLGDTYTIERSTSSATGPWTVVCNRCVTDYAAPWTDTTQPGGALWYRMQAYNRVGVPGAYSPVYQVQGVSSRLVDNLNDWSLSYSHTPNLHFDSSNPDRFNGDTSRAFRWYNNPTTPDEIIWHVPGMKTVTALAYFWPNEPISHFSFYIADDTLSWTQVFPTITVGQGDWIPVTYNITGLWNATYIRIRWNNPNGQSWSPQLSQLTIR